MKTKEWTLADAQAAAKRIQAGRANTPKKRVQALGRLAKGEMNKTEAAYARHLDTLNFSGQVLAYWFESQKFKIGTNACWYTPDFLVQMASGEIEVHEVKGHWADDALVKIKALALHYPYRVIAVKLVGGAWEVREFN